MRRYALLLVLAACGKSAPTSVTITAQAPAVGQRSTAQVEKHSTQTVTMQGEDLAIANDQTETRQTEVLEISKEAAE
jgi:hypothetical protein